MRIKGELQRGSKKNKPKIPRKFKDGVGSKEPRKGEV